MSASLARACDNSCSLAVVTVAINPANRYSLIFYNLCKGLERVIVKVSRCQFDLRHNTTEIVNNPDKREIFR